MQDWEIFERECAEYLRARYAGGDISVEEYGGPNSCRPDITVAGSVNVETKMARAQSGQFVVSYDDGEDVEDRFEISQRCSDSLNTASEAVIAELNLDTERYLDLVATQGWAHIDVDQATVASCIATHYVSTKGEELLMTGHLGGGKMLIPMDRLGEYFTTGAVLRYKPSGTRAIANFDEANAQAEFDAHLDFLRSTGKYGKVSGGKLYRDGKHRHVTLDASVDRCDRYFGHESYYLSPTRTGGLYRVKRRGRTNNITVVFTLDIRPERFRPDSGFELLDAKVS